MITLKLPMCPSINDYYGTKKGGFAKFIKPDGMQYRWQVRVELLQSKQKIAQGLLQVTCLFVFNNKRFNDIDNRLKPLFDALQIAGVIANDKDIINTNVSKAYQDCSESYILLHINDNQNPIKIEDYLHFFHTPLNIPLPENEK